MSDFDTSPFHCERFYDQVELLGGHWWQVRLQEQLEQAATPASLQSRRTLLAVVAGLTGVAVIGGTALVFARRGRDDVASVDLQREQGFDVGVRGQTVPLPDLARVDASGAPIRLEAMPALAVDLQPAQAEWRPFYVPTLFQALATDARLRSVMTGMDSPDMRSAHACAAVLRAILGAGDAAGVALVLDLPGPQAVAFAAGLQPDFDPVFVFDNWPHPRGVVPAHQTLAAALFHRPAFVAAARGTGSRPPVFVLDRARLSDYANEPDRFDNRYVAHLPAAADLRGRGVGRVLYVVGADAPRLEADDLNEQFVALREGGLDVKLLSLADIDVGSAPDRGPAPSTAPAAARGYGPWNHAWFFHHYGWGRLPATRMDEPRRAAGAAYRAAARTTRFGAPGLTAARFAGIGRSAPPAKGSGGSRSRSTSRYFGS
ncbi:MAG: hypothetical protein R3F56_13370 [Planctomycetota bacterium]